MDPATLVKGKPDPEIFLAAAEQLGVRFEDCVGIEDARAGIQAIKAARMVAVGVGADLPGCDWLVSDTRPLTFEALAALFPGTARRRSLRPPRRARTRRLPRGSAQPPAIAGSSRTVSRRLERRRELLEVPDVGLVHEHVHEAVDAALCRRAGAGRGPGTRRPARRAPRRPSRPRPRSASGRRPTSGARAGCGPGSCRQPVFERARTAPGCTGVSPGRPGSAGRASIPNRTASGVLSPLPVRSATTSSPSRITPRRRAASAAAIVTPPAVSV